LGLKQGSTARGQLIFAVGQGNRSDVGALKRQEFWMIVTGPHLRQAREAIGWSHSDMARALRLAGDRSQGEKRVREMEAGKRMISGPVAVAVESFLHGFLPVGFAPEPPQPEEAPPAPKKGR
jgi:hypothetical protein